MKEKQGQFETDLHNCKIAQTCFLFQFCLVLVFQFDKEIDRDLWKSYILGIATVRVWECEQSSRCSVRLLSPAVTAMCNVTVISECVSLSTGSRSSMRCMFAKCRTERQLTSEQIHRKRTVPEPKVVHCDLRVKFIKSAHPMIPFWEALTS